MLIRFAFALIGTVALTGTASADTIRFFVPLDGQQVVDGTGNPGQGDPDGIGGAVLLIDDVALTVSWGIAVVGIDPATFIFIQNAPAGMNGPVVATFGVGLSGTIANNNLAGVVADPTQYYLSIRTIPFSGAISALRGQLQGVPEPMALGSVAAGVGLLALLGARRFKPDPAQCRLGLETSLMPAPGMHRGIAGSRMGRCGAKSSICRRDAGMPRRA